MSGQTLVLGASGRIGRLLHQQWGAKAAIWQSRRPITGNGAENWAAFDLLEPDMLHQAAAGCARILCLAGPVPGRADTMDLADHSRLAEAAVRAGAAVGADVLLASSAAVYGAHPAAREDQPLTPANPYGVAKADMEARVLDLGAQLNVAVCNLRIGNIAGFDAALGGWHSGFTLDQFPDGTTPKRSYIGLSVLADVLASVLVQDDLPAALNIAQPGLVEMGALLEAAGRAYATRPAPDSALPAVGLDLSRLTGLLGADRLPQADAAVMARDFAKLEPVLSATPDL